MTEIKPEELAAALRELQAWAALHAPAQESPLRDRLTAHLGCDPGELPVVSREFAVWERPNVQVALDAYLAAGPRTHDFVGLSAQHGWHMGLAELAQPPQRGGYAVMSIGSHAAPQEHVTVQIGERTIVCAASGLFFIADGEERIVAAIAVADRHGMGEGIKLQAMAVERAVAEAFLAEIAALMHRHNVYRGRVLEVGGGDFGGASFEVRQLPKVERDGIVLPDGVLERIERHTVEFAEQADRLRDAGRHVKRGLLLYGPPGTGKTLTAMYLANRMPARTVFILTGGGLRSIGSACAMARDLAPSLVVMEDIDLIALDRDEYDSSVLLFELLNEMDGMQSDLDVVFVLTTNRADRLEPALAARPGRVDLAVELPLPDAAGRMQLLDLYGRGMTLRAPDLRGVVERTEGASPAFIRELLRRAALLATQGTTGELVVDDGHVAAALDELTSDGSPLTGRLLGMRDSG